MMPPVMLPPDDVQSPFFVHPNDQIGVKLVTDLFDGSDYVGWSHTVHMALVVKSKVVFIDGTISSPPDMNSALYVSWTRANVLVMSWLFNSMTREIRNSLMYFTFTAEIWVELRTRYARNDRIRVYQLEKSLSCLSQGTSSVTSYYTTFKSLWDEFCSYRAIPRCICTGCSCNLAVTMLQLQQSDFVLKFLVGLNDSFSNLRSQILCTAPLSVLSQVYNLIHQEECQRSLQVHSVSLDSMAMLGNSQGVDSTANAVNKKFYVTKKTVICTHCNKSGHAMDKCFALHGYPPHWKGQKYKKVDADSSKHRVNAVSSAASMSLDTDFVNPELYQKFLEFVKLHDPNPAGASASESSVMAMAATADPYTGFALSSSLLSCD